MHCLNELEKAHPNRLWLQISAMEKHQAWEQAQRHSNTLSRYNAYLNHIVVHTFLNFIEEWLSEESTPQPQIPNSDSLHNIWEVVNGATIGLGEKRIVLIPSETSYLEELCVPQEWVDIPSFAGDYYLAVQVNLGIDDSECWMSVRGFTTHRQLKCKASNQNRSYLMPVEHLTENLTLMQVIQEIDVRSQIPQLSTLSETEAQVLLQLLGNPSISPRQHNLPFEKWASLIDNHQWRQQLYQRRIAQLNENPKSVVNLSNWLRNIFEVGWESINTVINSESQNIAFAFRQREVHITGAAAERVKLIDLGMQLGNQCVALLLGLSQEEQQKVGIRVQLHPANGEDFLPSKIKLSLLSDFGTVLQTLESRSQDNFIQLKRFICPSGKGFSIQVALDNFSITEYFSIQPLDSSQHE
ncbi:hypothetical protein NIES4071_19730 [Calothrix sp. NIES-4071]|nr:hypothetical protein NIES4071_19730 [Calothrix sp. NIES-4071]BAZ56306.1 hypothetical protein NIES4105_19680 [Calothrix sp. NIES-4105]